jgi:transposase-like protein
METTAIQTPRSGRRRFTPEQRHELINRYQQSGLTQREFVAREGVISLAALGKWLQQERRRARARVEKPRFQELLFKQPCCGWQLEIVSPQNWTLRLASAPGEQTLAQLLRCLPC